MPVGCRAATSMYRGLRDRFLRAACFMESEERRLLNMSMGLMKWIYGGLCCRDLIDELVARLVDESAGAEKRELPRHFLEVINSRLVGELVGVGAGREFFPLSLPWGEPTAVRKRLSDLGVIWVELVSGAFVSSSNI